MEIEIIKTPATKKYLRELAKNGFGHMVKAVVDTEKKIMAVNGELHADEEMLLADMEGSRREHMWGINIYPEKSGEDFIEFDSMINIKPALGNRTRTVADPDVQKQIKNIVYALLRD